MKIFGFKWVPAFCKTTRVKPDAIFRLNSNRSVPALLNLASKRPPFLGNWCSILLSYTDMYNRFPPSRRISPLSGPDFYLTIFAPCLQVRIRSKHALNGSCGLPGGNAADRADRDAAGVLFYVLKLSGAA